MLAVEKSIVELRRDREIVPEPCVPSSRCGVTWGLFPPREIDESFRPSPKRVEVLADANCLGPDFDDGPISLRQRRGLSETRAIGGQDLRGAGIRRRQYPARRPGEWRSAAEQPFRPSGLQAPGQSLARAVLPRLAPSIGHCLRSARVLRQSEALHSASTRESSRSASIRRPVPRAFRLCTSAVRR